jgi:hypothetical protein
VPVAPISFSCPQHRIPLPSVPPSPPTLRLASTSPNRGPNAPKKLATDTRKWVPAASCPKHRIPGPSVPPSPPTPHPPSTSPNREPNAPKKGPRTRENGAHHSYLLLPPSKSRPIHPIQHSIHLPQHLHHPMRTQTCKKKKSRGPECMPAASPFIRHFETPVSGLKWLDSLFRQFLCYVVHLPPHFTEPMSQYRALTPKPCTALLIFFLHVWVLIG